MSEEIKDIEIKGDKVSEPVGAAALDYHGMVMTDDDLADVQFGKDGFYTSDPDVFEQRVTIIEKARPAVRLCNSWFQFVVSNFHNLCIQSCRNLAYRGHCQVVSA